MQFVALLPHKTINRTLVLPIQSIGYNIWLTLVLQLSHLLVGKFAITAK